MFNPSPFDRASTKYFELGLDLHFFPVNFQKFQAVLKANLHQFSTFKLLFRNISKALGKYLALPSKKVMSTVLQAKLNQKKKEEESAADWVIDQIVKHLITTPSCLCYFWGS